MFIPVVLNGGHEELVSKDKLQFLMHTKQVVFFSALVGGLFLVETKCEIRKDHTMETSAVNMMSFH